MLLCLLGIGLLSALWNSSLVFATVGTSTDTRDIQYQVENIEEDAAGSNHMPAYINIKWEILVLQVLLLGYIPCSTPILSFNF